MPKAVNKSLIWFDTNWRDYLSQWSGQQFGLDIETDGSPDPVQGKIAGISLCYASQDAYHCCYIPLNHVAKNSQMSREQLKIFLESHSFVTYSGSYERLWFRYNPEFKIDFKLAGDAEITSSMLQIQVFGLKDMAQALYHKQVIKLEDVLGKGKFDFTAVDLEDPFQGPKAAVYAMQDAHLALSMYLVQRAQLEKLGMRDCLELEMEIYQIMAEMNGYPIDIPTLQRELSVLEASQNQEANQIYQVLGVRPFPLNSTQKLGECLFGTNGLGLTPSILTDKTKIPSTSQEALELIKDQHPLIQKIMDWRSNSSVVSSLQAAQEKYIHNNKIYGRWHTIGKDGTTRCYAERASLTSVPHAVRRAFLAPQGKIYVGFDYKQAEFRILAALSQDQAMIELLNSGKDIHAWTYHMMTGLPLEDVTPALREVAKTVFYATIYSVEAPSYHVANNLKIGHREAQVLVEDFFEVYPRLKKYRFEQITEAIKGRTSTAKVEIRTMLNRRRLLDAESGNRFKAMRLKNQIINSLGQQNCGTILKIALRNLWRAKQQNNQLFASMDNLLPVFDALWYTIDDHLVQDHVRAAKPLVEYQFNNVSMKTEWKIGRTWGTMEKLDL